MPNFFVRAALAGLTAVLAINLWTGAPLFAIWVGSRVQKGTGLTMSTVLVVMGVLAVCVTLLGVIAFEAWFFLFAGSSIG
jgi:hypothetical protein